MPPNEKYNRMVPLFLLYFLLLKEYDRWQSSSKPTSLWSHFPLVILSYNFYESSINLTHWGLNKTVDMACGLFYGILLESYFCALISLTQEFFFVCEINNEHDPQRFTQSTEQAMQGNKQELLWRTDCQYDIYISRQPTNIPHKCPLMIF